jgi:SNF2 family DNA or RNA helicase
MANLEDIMRAKREARAAAKRADRIETAVKTGTVQNFLRKGEALAFAEHLKPYQQQAVLMTVKNKRTNSHTLNASDVGIGKTRVAGSFVNTVQFKKVLWLTSVTLVQPTVKELANIGAIALNVTGGAQPYLNIPLPGTVIYVTNYETIKRDPGLLSPNQWDCVVIDEVTKLKGGASFKPTLIWKETKKLLHDLNPEAYRLFLSGTPAVNRPNEIWAYLHLFDPQRFDSYATFQRIFCRLSYGKPVMSVDKLMELLQGMIIRQTVSNLGLEGVPNLDDPTWFHSVTEELHVDRNSTVGKAYLQLASESLTALDDHHSLAPSMQLELILRLRQLLLAGETFNYKKHYYYLDHEANVIHESEDVTLHLEGPFPKLDRCEEIIASLQGEGEQVVVFSTMNQPLHNLKKALDRTGFYTVGLLTGEATPDQRQKLVTDFQHGTLDVLLINKLAGAEGLNLQKCEQWSGGARFMIHLDSWWNPAKERQANGRCVRMNTNVPVQAIYLHVANSVDDFIQNTIDTKAEQISQLDVGIVRKMLQEGTLG